jgi:hypothetical protein
MFKNLVITASVLVIVSTFVLFAVTSHNMGQLPACNTGSYNDNGLAMVRTIAPTETQPFFASLVGGRYVQIESQLTLVAGEWYITAMTTSECTR